eukprot:gene6463-3097_t
MGHRAPLVPATNQDAGALPAAIILLAQIAFRARFLRHSPWAFAH